MSILTDASLIVTPNAYKAGSLLAVVPSNGNGDLTWTRNSGATRVNSEGLIEVVAANVPRLDHSLGGCPSILLEPQRTNLLSSSDDFGSLSWAKQFCSVLTNTIQSPDNSINADTLLANTLGVGQASQVFRNISITINTPYTISIYAKKNTSNFVFFREYFSTNSEKITWFNLLTGQVSTVAIGHTATITNIGNDWYRCVVTTTPNATRTSSLGIGVSDSNNSLVITSTSSIFIWGAQLEAGAYPTSYIPTTSATVTRAADVASKTGISSLINSEEGSLFIESAASADNLEIRIITLSNGTSSTRLAVGYNGISNGVYFNFNVGGVESFSYQNTSYDITKFIKIAISYKLNEFIVFINGVKVYEDLLGNVPAANTLNRLGFDNGGGLAPYFGILKNIQIYKTALTETQLQTLTTL